MGKEGRFLLLVRHGSSEQVPTVPAHLWTLSEKGREKCRHFARQLLPYQPTRILTSHEPKASETGQIIAHELHLPCHIAANLHEHERATVPWFDSVEVFQAAVRQIFTHPDQLMWGEETGNQAQTRFSAAVHDLLGQYPDDCLAIVTHGTVLSLFVGQYNQIEIVPFWEGLEMPALVPLTLPHFQLTPNLPS